MGVLNEKRCKNWRSAPDINALIDNLSEISDLTESTRNKVKTYRLVFSNFCNSVEGYCIF
jgi:hypothetical protein